MTNSPKPPAGLAAHVWQPTPRARTVEQERAATLDSAAYLWLADRLEVGERVARLRQGKPSSEVPGFVVFIPEGVRAVEVFWPKVATASYNEETTPGESQLVGAGDLVLAAVAVRLVTFDDGRGARLAWAYSPIKS